MFINQDLPYKVADISLSDWGRKEIEIAEKEVTIYGMDLDKFLSQAQVVGVKSAEEDQGNDELIG